MTRKRAVDFDEARALVLRLLEGRGKATNSDMVEVCGDDQKLFERVRQDLILNDLAEDKKGVGLIYTGHSVQETSPIEAHPGPPSQATPPATTSAKEVFISYAHADFDEVRKIVRYLEGAKVDLYWDKTGIRSGNWRSNLVLAIQGCKAFIFICSPMSMQRPDVRTEIFVADDFRRARLPLHLDDAPHDFPPEIHWCLTSWHGVPVVPGAVDHWLPEVLSGLHDLGVSCDPSYLPMPGPSTAAVVPSVPRPTTMPVYQPGAGAPRRFRLFVSSTFADLTEERWALAERVWPRLQELCVRHGFRFEAVDMRWGISEEASLDQQTVKIDLAEIDRCQTISPRLNFMVLLGDRLGWRPPPPQIPSHEFEQILQRVSPEEQVLLHEWYLRDDNAVPPEYCLRPREGQFVEHDVWAPIEGALHSILERAIRDVPLEEADRLKYEAYLLEQEIDRGALRAPDESVFCFLRTIRDLPRDPRARYFVDVDDLGGPDPQARARLTALKERLRTVLPDSTFEYEAGWADGHPTTDHLDRLCDDVYASLSRVILEEIGRLVAVDGLSDEIARHDTIRRERARMLVGRQSVLRRIDNHIDGDDPHPLVLFGPAGADSTGVMARAAQLAAEKSPQAQLVLRFIGATPDSSSGQKLLDGLCKEVSRRYGADEATVPGEYRELVRDFRERLALASDDRPLILLLDSLDQLSPAEGARTLSWLPTELPPGVRLIVSTLSGDALKPLWARFPESSFVELTPMEPREGEELLDLWLEDVGRTLQGHQKEEVTKKFAIERLPLWLKLAFEEARRWLSTTGLPQTELPPTISELIHKKLFDRVEDDHGYVLVRHALGYLAAAKNGVSEDEMIDLLSLGGREGAVLQEFFRGSPHSPMVDRLPELAWSRLFFDIEPYLTERAADGASLMSFYHRQLTEAVYDEYLAGHEGIERHRELATYFGWQRLEAWGEDTTTPNPRQMSELPYHQMMGELWDDLIRTLTDFRFLELKAATLGVDMILEDFHLALQRIWGYGADRKRRMIVTGIDLGNGLELRCPFCDLISSFREEWRGEEIECPHCGSPLRVNPFVLESRGPGHSDGGEAVFPPRGSRSIDSPMDREQMSSGPSRILGDLATALRRERHVLRRRPDLTWQQLYNRLQWSDDIIRDRLAGELAHRSDQTAAPWMRLRKPLRESKALVQTLEGHGASVRRCAVSRDGSFIVSAGGDYSLKVWDAATGAELATLKGHDDWVNDCAISRDGSVIVSASSDGTLKVWDRLEERERATLKGHTAAVNACVIGIDERIIVSASDDGTLKVWDPESSDERITLSGHSGKVVACAMSGDGSYVVSASDDGTLKLWDCRDWTALATLQGHKGGVLGCAFSPDGNLVVSASDDRTLNVWDAVGGRQLTTLEGHTDAVRGCAFSPDGRFIVSAGSDRTLKVWDVATAVERATLRGHGASVTDCTVSPDGSLVVSASDDGTVKVWDVTIREQPDRIGGHEGGVFSCAISPDGSFVVSGGDDGTLKVWDPETGEERAALIGHRGGVFGCAISPDGSFVVSGGDDGILRVWDPVTGEERAALIGHRGGVFGCAISPDGSFVVSGGDDRTLRIWDTASWSERITLEGHASSVNRCAVGPDGTFVVSASDDETVRIWDSASGEQRARLVGHDSSVYGCSVSPDGSFVVSASWDNTLRVWDVTTGRQESVLIGHTDQVWDCAVSPDGSFIVSAGRDGTVRVWDRSGGERASLPLQTGVLSVALHPWLPLAAFGDVGGGLQLVDLVGIEHGPSSRR
jgi:WD40 repeat protein